jgi:heme/copper-type cytochrome/quinol oxidase subunit 2
MKWEVAAAHQKQLRGNTLMDEWGDTMLVEFHTADVMLKFRIPLVDVNIDDVAINRRLRLVFKV